MQNHNQGRADGKSRAGVFRRPRTKQKHQVLNGISVSHASQPIEPLLSHDFIPRRWQGRDSHAGMAERGKPRIRPNIGGDRREGQNDSCKADRKFLGFMKLYGLLTNEDSSSDTVIMALHRNLKEWNDLLDVITEKKAMSDDLFVVIIHLLGEKVCDESSLRILQAEIVSGVFGECFASKLRDICKEISQPTRTSKTSRLRNEGSTDVDHSRCRILRNLFKLFSFVTLKMPTTAVDHVYSLVISIIGTISVCLCYCIGTTDEADLRILDGEFKSLANTIVSLVRKKEEKDVKVERIRKYGFTLREEDDMHDMTPPEDFREISIIPSIDEIVSVEETFLRTNKKAGAYNNADHYLDVQYRLLREDFVRPLKRGIQDFLKNRHDYLTKKKKMPIGNVRIYPNVQITNVQLVRDSLTYSLQLTEDIYKRVNWEKSKRLLQGSLLVLTTDNFRSAFFGVVARRDPKELKSGVFGIIWEGIPPGLDRQRQEYLLVECEVYFEAYRHTLQILKELELETFPLSKFIVFGSTDVCAPKYLQDTDQLMNIGDHYVSPLIGPWPNSKQLGLDDTQFAAFHAALTKEFAIIQGPPGTGKTFLEVLERSGRQRAIDFTQNFVRTAREILCEINGMLTSPSLQNLYRYNSKGLKIAEVFLRNLNIWWDGKGPILVVCYTNHALDQFLEGILNIMKRISPNDDPALIRVGGRSKTPALDEYSLSRQRGIAARLHKYGRDYWITKNNAISSVRSLEYERAQVLNHVVGLSNPEGIIKLKSLGKTVYDRLEDEFPKALLDLLKKPEWFGIKDSLFERSISESELLNTWFTVKDEPTQSEFYSQRGYRKDFQRGELEFSEEEEDYDLEELLESRIFDNVLLEADSLCTVGEDNTFAYLPGTSIKEIEEQLRKNMLLPSLIDNAEQLPPAKKKIKKNMIQEENHRMRSRLNFLKLLFQSYRRGLLLLPDVEPILNPPVIIDNTTIYFETLSFAKKWAIYFSVIEKARVLKTREVKVVEDSLIVAQKALQEVQTQGDGQLLQRTKIVGMTTTGAAKYNDLLKMMKSKIVIVEEAAEVLESHIVTCISQHCQHLILIGDHQQLRPSTTVYDLSTKYNLDISLFERMLNNNLNCFKLKVQHRMRPEICDLIVGTIYTELENHVSVRDYPIVDGIEKNLFFVTHNQLENSDSDSMSKSNLYEAKFMAKLCRYLVQQGYSTDRITILTTYTGQMFLLKQEIRAFQNCSGVRVTVVDNFQGEENDIILLSLVRSNENKQIGFLKTDNRICVAISRARHGLYICGNMDMLASQSKTWRQIREKLFTRDECGQKLDLKCQIHGILTQVETDKDFAKVPEGGCMHMCDTELSCGHSCKSVCHIPDRNHLEYKCRLHCQKNCVNHHRCMSMCFQQCPPCPVLMDKTLKCLHVKQLKCFVPEGSVTCVVQVEKQLSCGHVAEMSCHKDSSTYSCKIKVTKTLPCLHTKANVECEIDADSIICKVVVSKNLDPCGHTQEAPCHIRPDMIKCDTIVQKRFPDCGHEMGVKCHNLKSTNIYCKIACPERLKCGHACTKICHVQNDPRHLEYECRKECGKTCPNGHTCSTKHKCFQPCKPCKIPTEKTLDCGIHKTVLECSIDVTGMECEFPCELKLPLCGHPCQKLCFQSCEPCQVKVQKASPCGHPQETKCCLAASQHRCEVLVKPRFGSACNHDTRVPCRLQSSVLPQDSVKYCQEKCKFSFEAAEGKIGCGHMCKGTCAECHQGRLHKKCQEKCGKTLVCGHVCSFPCAKACPPCQKKCDLKCDHSECKQLCGEPCTGCNEKCTWECEHKKCSKLCREPCDRTTCEMACPRTIMKCGHKCVGFCGEPCPTLCQICDKEELTEVFFGTEDEEHARFILLEDCNHCFESTGLDYYMLEAVEKGSILAKGCPKCKTFIRHSRRYGDILRSQLKDVMSVKKKLFGNEKKLMQQQSDLIHELNSNSNVWKVVLPTVQNFVFEKIAHVSRADPYASNGPKTDRIINKKVDEITMASIELIANHGKDVITLMQDDEAVNLKPALTAELQGRYLELFASLITRELPLSDAEVRDFDREFERLFDLKQLFLRKSCPRLTDDHPVAQPLYKQANTIIFSPRVYTKEIRSIIQELLKGIDESIKTGLGISDRERREILASFHGMAQGHWFKCPNGHIYMIGDCGGAMVEAKCGECSARIGGGQHRLRTDNELAGEMDGATRPLWPN